MQNYFRYATKEGSSTSLLAHLGGALAGLIIGVQVLKNRKSEKWERVLKWVLLIVSIIAFIVFIICNDYGLQLDASKGLRKVQVPTDNTSWSDYIDDDGVEQLWLAAVQWKYFFWPETQFKT